VLRILIFALLKIVLEQAKVAHLVEHDLAKVGVAGSSPVFRSKNPNFGSGFFLSLSIDALVVELVDTQDLDTVL
jgi:hypothetical protein